MNSNLNNPPLDSQEALRKIDEIHEILVSHQKVLFSSRRMIAIGLMVALIPAIEHFTNFLTFGFDFGPHADLIVTLVHVAFYTALSMAITRSAGGKGNRNDKSTHPLIRRAFGIVRPYWVSVLGVVFAFSAIGQGRFIYPVIFLLMGLLFNLYGRFSVPTVLRVSWSYIVLGIFLIYGTSLNLPSWISWGCCVYQGATFVLMGLAMKAPERSLAEASAGA